MSVEASASRDDRNSQVAVGALEFDAPYVVERLVKDRIVDTGAEGERLFDEIKKYLVLADLNRDVVLGMYSARIDEAWHAFILYTAEYSEFCQRFFGRYLRHTPRNAPKANTGLECAHSEATFDDFRARYEEFFNQPLPDEWYNERSIIPARRMYNDSVGSMIIVRHESVAVLRHATGDTILSGNGIICDALEFITNTGAFYVRELPGDLTDEEKVTLVVALTRLNVLRVAP